MNANPYEAPALLGEDTAAVTNARQRVGPIAIGLQWPGATFSVVGALGMAMMVILRFAQLGADLFADYGRGRPPPGFISDGVMFFAVFTVILLLSGLAFYAGRRLRRLDSLRWAYAACVISILFSPMLIVTLPLGIYGLFVLRRADVRAVIQEQEAARAGIVSREEPLPA
jgi:hypothetical protein